MSALMPKQSIDRRLIKAAMKIGHTAQDLSDAVNGQLSPAQALDRTSELLTGATIWDEVQERRLLLIRMGAWLDELQATHGKNLKAAGAINRAFKLVSDQLERSHVNLEDISTKLADSHAEYFVTAVMKAAEVIVARAQEESGEIIDAEIVQEITAGGVEKAQEYLETVTIKPEAE